MAGQSIPFLPSYQHVARCSEFDKAFAMIERVATFRHPGYLPPIRFHDVWNLFKQAQRLAEDGDLTVARRMVELCPKPTDRDMEHVSKFLQSRHLNRTWWGWDALGVGMSRRGQMIQKMSRENAPRGKEQMKPGGKGFNPKKESFASFMRSQKQK